MNSFKQTLAYRNATNYAAFLSPHLKEGMRLLDCGCGVGSITVGLIDHVRPGLVVGADRAFGGFRGAIQYASEHEVAGLEFIGADAYATPFRDDTFDAALAHSMLETLDRPSEALREIRRVLKPGGVVGVASVEYGGLLLAGPSLELLQNFYKIRQELWLRNRIANPWTGRNLRAFLVEAGFSSVEASARYIPYGDPEAVKRFGMDRASDCQDPEFAKPAAELNLADSVTLQAIAAAWSRWATDPRSFAAFAWGNAIAWKQRCKKALLGGHSREMVDKKQDQTRSRPIPQQAPLKSGLLNERLLESSANRFRSDRRHLISGDGMFGG